MGCNLAQVAKGMLYRWHPYFMNLVGEWWCHTYGMLGVGLCASERLPFRHFKSLLACLHRGGAFVF